MFEGVGGRWPGHNPGGEKERRLTAVGLDAIGQIGEAGHANEGKRSAPDTGTLDRRECIALWTGQADDAVPVRQAGHPDAVRVVPDHTAPGERDEGAVV